MDSAGIRRPDGGVEADAIRSARALLERCEIALVLYDTSRAPGPDAEVLTPAGNGKRIIVVGNKIDLLDAPPQAPVLPRGLSSCPVIFISARESRNIGGLEAAMLEPYAGWLGRCEDGCPVLFDEGMLAAIRRIAAALEDHGCEAALVAPRELLAGHGG